MLNDTIKTIIVDSRPVMRRGLIEILREIKGLQILGELDHISEAAEQLIEPATLFVMHLESPFNETCNAVRLLKETAHAHFLAFTDDADAATLAAWLQAGGSGYITTESSPNEITKSVRRVAAGYTYIAQISEQTDHRTAETTCTLSKRETEVISLIAAGHTAAKIAEFLQISVKTIETYRSRIAGKTGLHTRAELVQYALSHSLMKLDSS